MNGGREGAVGSGRGIPKTCMTRQPWRLAPAVSCYPGSSWAARQGSGVGARFVVLYRFWTGVMAPIPPSLPNTEPTAIPGRGRGAPAGSESIATLPTEAFLSRRAGGKGVGWAVCGAIASVPPPRCQTPSRTPAKAAGAQRPQALSRKPLSAALEGHTVQPRPRHRRAKRASNPLYLYSVSSSIARLLWPPRVVIHSRK